MTCFQKLKVGGLAVKFIVLYNLMFAWERIFISLLAFTSCGVLIKLETTQGNLVCLSYLCS